MASLTSASAIDGVLVQWGDRLFYPGNRIVKVAPTPRLNLLVQRRAAVIRQRIEATVILRAPQVIVRVSGGGRGMGPIADHFRYITNNGRLPFEDDRGVVSQDRAALHDLTEQWRLGGSPIAETSHRREAFNLVLAMPRGTDAQAVLRAAREVAQIELQDHRYVMVLHEHQHAPHVHLCVRAESERGKRLHLGPAELHRWRTTFAEQLRGWGVEAEATRQATRGEGRRFEPLAIFKAREQEGLKTSPVTMKSGEGYQRSRMEALEAWAHIVVALQASDQASDRELAQGITRYLQQSTFAKEHARQRERERPAPEREHQRGHEHDHEHDHNHERERDIQPAFASREHERERDIER